MQIEPEQVDTLHGLVDAVKEAKDDDRIKALCYAIDLVLREIE